MQEQIINPITGKPAHKYLTEKQAKELGYFDFQFMLKHLEDENEFVKFFKINGEDVIVDIDKPNLQYKKKLILDYERVLQTTEHKKEDNLSSAVGTVAACSIDDESCVSCSG